MSYRDDHDAALARVAALEREKRQLEAENARLRQQSEPSPPTQPRQPSKPSVLSKLDQSELEHPVVQRAGMSMVMMILVFVFALIAAMAKGC